MSRTQNLSMSLICGDTLTFYLVFDGDGLTEDLTEAWFSCKQSFTDTSYVFQKTITNGGITKESTNRYLVRVAPEDTLDVTPGVYKYDVQYQYGDDVFTPLVGDLVLYPGVTDEIVVIVSGS